MALYKFRIIIIIIIIIIVFVFLLFPVYENAGRTTYAFTSEIVL